MKIAKDLANELGNIAEEGREEITEQVSEKAGEFIDESVSALESGIERVAAELKEEIQDTLHPERRRIPWFGIAAGLALVAGAIYLSRHRAQRVILQKGLKRGIEGGAMLALSLPGGLKQARKSADHVIRESARLWDKIPVKVVMK